MSPKFFHETHGSSFVFSVNIIFTKST